MYGNKLEDHQPEAVERKLQEVEQTHQVVSFIMRLVRANPESEVRALKMGIIGLAELNAELTRRLIDAESSLPMQFAAAKGSGLVLRHQRVPPMRAHQ